MARSVDLRAWVAERRAAAGLALTVDEGEPIVVPPLDLWPDNRQIGDAALLVELLGGEANVERFRAAGGTVASLLKLLAEAGGGDPEAPEGSSES